MAPATSAKSGIIKDVFKDWIEPLRKGFQKVLDNPSKHGRENVTDDNGRFFEDYCNWERIEEFKDCLFNSPGAQIVAEATNSKSIQIFHEHIFIKDPGTHKETPWHQDMPYYCVDGNDTGSFWIPLDEVDHKNNLKLILGSHKWSKLIRPTKWSNNQSWYDDDSAFMDLPPSKEFEKSLSMVAERLTNSGVVSISSNRKSFRVIQEPINQFREYMAVYAQEQAECHFSEALISNLEKFWNAQSRKE